MTEYELYSLRKLCETLDFSLLLRGLARVLFGVLEFMQALIVSFVSFENVVSKSLFLVVF
jgi:hypothetical protein